MAAVTVAVAAVAAAVTAAAGYRASTTFDGQGGAVCVKASAPTTPSTDSLSCAIRQELMVKASLGDVVGNPIIAWPVQEDEDHRLGAASA